jgi:hypothetical protein
MPPQAKWQLSRPLISVDPNHLLVDVVGSGPVNPLAYGDSEGMSLTSIPTQVSLSLPWGFTLLRDKFVADLRTATESLPGVISKIRFWGVFLEPALALPGALHDRYQIPRVPAAAKPHAPLCPWRNR